eukprot:460305_1
MDEKQRWHTNFLQLFEIKQKLQKEFEEQQRQFNAKLLENEQSKQETQKLVEQLQTQLSNTSSQYKIDIKQLQESNDELNTQLSQLSLKHKLLQKQKEQSFIHRRIKFESNKILCLQSPIAAWSHIDSSEAGGTNFNISADHQKQEKEQIQQEIDKWLQPIQEIYPHIAAKDLKISNIYENTPSECLVNYQIDLGNTHVRKQTNIESFSDQFGNTIIPILTTFSSEISNKLACKSKDVTFIEQDKLTKPKQSKNNTNTTNNGRNNKKKNNNKKEKNNTNKKK